MAHKKAPVGSSFNKNGGPFQAISLKKSHSSGKTAPTFNAERMDRLEKSGNKKSGGVKK